MRLNNNNKQKISRENQGMENSKYSSPDVKRIHNPENMLKILTLFLCSSVHNYTSLGVMLL